MHTPKEFGPRWRYETPDGYINIYNLGRRSVDRETVERVLKVLGVDASNIRLEPLGRPLIPMSGQGWDVDGRQRL